MGREMNIVPQFSLDGKVAVVTGSTRGIGRAIAVGLAAAGAAVTVNGRNPDATQKAAAEIAAGGRCALAMESRPLLRAACAMEKVRMRTRGRTTTILRIQKSSSNPE